MECLFIKKTLDGVVGQLFHDKEGFIKVQEHGEIVVLAMGQNMDALSENDISGFLQPPHFIPGDDQFHCGITITVAVIVCTQLNTFTFITSDIKVLFHQYKDAFWTQQHVNLNTRQEYVN